MRQEGSFSVFVGGCIFASEPLWLTVSASVAGRCIGVHTTQPTYGAKENRVEMCRTKNSILQTTLSKHEINSTLVS